MTQLRFLTAGESHGPALTVIIEGMPAGLTLTAEPIDAELRRRQRGYGRGDRMKIESDRVRFLSGVRHGRTLGSPISLLVENLDWSNWQAAMEPAPPIGEGWLADELVTRPRPGHADLAGGMKYGRRDLRDVLERASARETAARVAAGAVARVLLDEFGIEVHSWVDSIGDAGQAGSLVDLDEPPDNSRIGALSDLARKSPVSCPDVGLSARMVEAIEAAASAGDTLGGCFTVAVTGLPTGLGSHVQWDRRLEGTLAAGLMSLNGIKGVEVGLGFEAARRPGSKAHDELCPLQADTPLVDRHSNRAGGIEGGITNGQPLVLRAAMKPISTLRRPLRSVDLKTGEAVEAHHERSDACAVPSAAVVAEAIVALALAGAFLDKFGGDNMADLFGAYDAYCKRLSNYLSGGSGR